MRWLLAASLGLGVAYLIEWLQYAVTPGYPKPPPFKGFRK